MTSGGDTATQDNDDLRQRWVAALAAARSTLRAANTTHRAALRAGARLGPASPRTDALVDARVREPDGDIDQLKHELEQMRRALATRDLIWSAKTIIAATTGADPDEAHQLLVRQSQYENRKLREVAADIVERHQRAAS